MKHFYTFCFLLASYFIVGSTTSIASDNFDPIKTSSTIKDISSSEADTNLEEDEEDDTLVLYEFTGEVLTPSQSHMGATASEFQVTGATPTFNSTNAGWSGSGVPIAQSGNGWDAGSADDAKYFFYTVNADAGFEMDLSSISFEWRATNAGPSAITVEINGVEIETFDAPNNETTIFTAPLTSFDNLSEIEVRIKGWDNESRETSGTGIFRVNDVRLNGEIYATSSVLVSDTNEITDLNYIEGNGPSTPQSFMVSGLNLDESDVMASVQEISDFEISDSADGTFGQTVTLSSFGGEETEIHVRLKEGLTPNMYNDEITISGGGAESATVNVSGEVIEEVFLIYEFTGEVLTPSQSPMGATASEFQVTGTTPTFNSSNQGWTGSGVPIAQSGSDWGAENADDAKYFFFTVDADSGFNMDLSNISFEWRATGNGPSAVTVEINGVEIETFNTPSNSTTLFTAPLTSFDNLSEVEVRIKGWDNGSREEDDSTNGSGILRVNDVRLDGEIYATTSVLVASPSEITGLEYIEGNGPSNSQSFMLTGIDVDGSDVTASLAEGSSFEISDNEVGTYGESVTLASYDGSETPLYVRLKADLQVNDYAEDLTLMGGGAETAMVSLMGKVKEDRFVLYEFTGDTPSAMQFPENATTSDFLVSADGPVGFGNAQSTSWTAGSGVPYANSRPGWDATSAADAKYFYFTVTADEGYKMTASNVSFEYRATGNGPSAITVEINGTEIETFDVPRDDTKVFSASIENAEDLSEIEIRIKGWLNGSRDDTDGTGFFRINDVSLDGVITETLSTGEFAMAENIQLYPNPSTNGQFNIRAEGFSAGDVNLKIYNLVGQQVYAKTHQTSSDIVVNSELKTGVYIVELSQADKRFTKKLIIK